jgi:hypothetical protein
MFARLPHFNELKIIAALDEDMKASEVSSARLKLHQHRITNTESGRDTRGESSNPYTTRPDTQP